MKKVCSLLFFLVIFIPIFSQENIYDSNNSKKFASYLVKTNQYAYAIEEYERLLFSAPFNDTIKLSLLSTYRKAGLYEKGISRIHDFFANDTIPDFFSIEYVKLLLLNQSFDKAKIFLSNNVNLQQKDRIIFLLNTELLQLNFKEANVLLSSFDATESHYLNAYKVIIEEGLAIKYKKPLIALGLSVIIPGSGKFYTKNWVDGLMSLIFVSGTAWQAHRGFNKNGVNSTYGWIYASVSFAFYSGNLYGSYKSANQYNERIREKISQKTKILFNSML